MLVAFRIALRTGNAVKLRLVPQNKMNPVLFGSAQVGPLFSLLMYDHQSEISAPMPNGTQMEAAAIEYE